MSAIHAIEVRHLSKRFGQKMVVDDLSFNVRQGEVFGLLGPNGAGKTTTLRMLTTLLKADAGQVKIFGHDTVKEGRLARSMFGLTGQYASVDEDISARENLMIFARLNGLSRAAAKQRTAELLADFSLADSADKALANFSGGDAASPGLGREPDYPPGPDLLGRADHGTGSPHADADVGDHSWAG